jgi:ribosomal protein L29
MPRRRLSEHQIARIKTIQRERQLGIGAAEETQP